MLYGNLVHIKKNGSAGTKVPLVEDGECIIGSTPDSHVRLRSSVSNESHYCAIRTTNGKPCVQKIANNLSILLNGAEFVGTKNLLTGDVIELVGKKFKWEAFVVTKTPGRITKKVIPKLTRRRSLSDFRSKMRKSTKPVQVGNLSTWEETNEDNLVKTSSPDKKHRKTPSKAVVASKGSARLSAIQISESPMKATSSEHTPELIHDQFGFKTNSARKAKTVTPKAKKLTKISRLPVKSKSVEKPTTMSKRKFFPENDEAVAELPKRTQKFFATPVKFSPKHKIRKYSPKKEDLLMEEKIKRIVKSPGMKTPKIKITPSKGKKSPSKSPKGKKTPVKTPVAKKTPVKTPKSAKVVAKTPKSAKILTKTPKEEKKNKTPIKSPKSSVKTPKSSVKTPKSSVKALKSSVKTPKSSVKTPKSSVKTPKSSVKTPKNTPVNAKSPKNLGSAKKTPKPAVKTPKQTPAKSPSTSKAFLAVKTPNNTPESSPRTSLKPSTPLQIKNITPVSTPVLTTIKTPRSTKKLPDIISPIKSVKKNSKNKLPAVKENITPTDSGATTPENGVKTPDNYILKPLATPQSIKKVKSEAKKDASLRKSLSKQSHSNKRKLSDIADMGVSKKIKLSTPEKNTTVENISYSPTVYIMKSLTEPKRANGGSSRNSLPSSMSNRSTPRHIWSKQRVTTETPRLEESIGNYSPVSHIETQNASFHSHNESLNNISGIEQIVNVSDNLIDFNSPKKTRSPKTKKSLSLIDFTSPIKTRLSRSLNKFVPDVNTPEPLKALNISSKTHHSVQKSPIRTILSDKYENITPEPANRSRHSLRNIENNSDLDNMSMCVQIDVNSPMKTFNASKITKSMSDKFNTSFTSEQASDSDYSPRTRFSKFHSTANKSGLNVSEIEDEGNDSNISNISIRSDKSKKFSKKTNKSASVHEIATNTEENISANISGGSKRSRKSTASITGAQNASRRSLNNSSLNNSVPDLVSDCENVSKRISKRLSKNELNNTFESVVSDSEIVQSVSKNISRSSRTRNTLNESGISKFDSPNVSSLKYSRNSRTLFDFSTPAPTNVTRTIKSAQKLNTFDKSSNMSSPASTKSSRVSRSSQKLTITVDDSTDVISDSEFNTPASKKTNLGNATVTTIHDSSLESVTVSVKKSTRKMFTIGTPSQLNISARIKSAKKFNKSLNLEKLNNLSDIEQSSKNRSRKSVNDSKDVSQNEQEFANSVFEISSDSVLSTRTGKLNDSYELSGISPISSSKKSSRSSLKSVKDDSLIDTSLNLSSRSSRSRKSLSSSKLNDSESSNSSPGNRSLRKSTQKLDDSVQNVDEILETSGRQSLNKSRKSTRNMNDTVPINSTLEISGRKSLNQFRRSQEFDTSTVNELNDSLERSTRRSTNILNNTEQEHSSPLKVSGRRSLNRSVTSQKLDISTPEDLNSSLERSTRRLTYNLNASAKENSSPLEVSGRQSQNRSRISQKLDISTQEELNSSLERFTRRSTFNLNDSTKENSSPLEISGRQSQNRSRRSQEIDISTQELNSPLEKSTRRSTFNVNDSAQKNISPLEVSGRQSQNRSRRSQKIDISTQELYSPLEKSTRRSTFNLNDSAQKNISPLEVSGRQSQNRSRRSQKIDISTQELYSPLEKSTRRSTFNLNDSTKENSSPLEVSGRQSQNRSRRSQKIDISIQEGLNTSLERSTRRSTHNLNDSAQENSSSFEVSGRKSLNRSSRSQKLDDSTQSEDWKLEISSPLEISDRQSLNRSRKSEIDNKGLGLEISRRSLNISRRSQSSNSPLRVSRSYNKSVTENIADESLELLENTNISLKSTQAFGNTTLRKSTDVINVSDTVKSDSKRKSNRNKSPLNDLTKVQGVKSLFKTPKTQKSPKNDLTNIAGIKGMYKTPGRQQKSPANDLTKVAGVKQLLLPQKSPKNDLTEIKGVKKMFKTPKRQRSPENNLTDIRGVKKLLKTPKAQSGPKNDLTDLGGVKKLMEGYEKSPKNDLTIVAGVKRVLRTPRAQASPRNDLTDVKGVQKLFVTKGTPKNDLRDVRGVKRMFGEAGVKNDYSQVNNLDAIFDDLREDADDTLKILEKVNHSPVRTYERKGRSLSPQKIDKITKPRLSQLQPTETDVNVRKWVEEQKTYAKESRRSSRISGNNLLDEKIPLINEPELLLLSDEPSPQNTQSKDEIEQKPSRKQKVKDVSPKMQPEVAHEEKEEPVLRKTRGRQLAEIVEPSPKTRSRRKVEETDKEVPLRKTRRGKIIEETTEEPSPVRETRKQIQEEEISSPAPRRGRQKKIEELKENTVESPSPRRRGRQAIREEIENVTVKKVTHRIKAGKNEVQTEMVEVLQQTNVKTPKLYDEESEELTISDIQLKTKKQVTFAITADVDVPATPASVGRSTRGKKVVQAKEVPLKKARGTRGKKIVEKVDEEQLDEETLQKKTTRRGKKIVEETVEPEIKTKTTTDTIVVEEEPVKSRRTKRKAEVIAEEKEEQPSKKVTRATRGKKATTSRSKKIADEIVESVEEITEEPVKSSRSRRNVKESQSIEEIKEPSPLKFAKNSRSKRKVKEVEDVIEETPTTVKKGRSRKKVDEITESVEEIKEAEPVKTTRSRRKAEVTETPVQIEETKTKTTRSRKTKKTEDVVEEKTEPRTRRRKVETEEVAPKKQKVEVKTKGKSMKSEEEPVRKSTRTRKVK